MSETVCVNLIFRLDTLCQPVMCFCRQPHPVPRSVRWNPIFSRWHPSTLPWALLNNTRWRIDFVSGFGVCVCVCACESSLWVRGRVPWCTRTSRVKSITGWPQTAALPLCLPEAWTLAGLFTLRWPEPVLVWHLILPCARHAIVHSPACFITTLTSVVIGAYII